MMYWIPYAYCSSTLSPLVSHLYKISVVSTDRCDAVPPPYTYYIYIALLYYIYITMYCTYIYIAMYCNRLHYIYIAMYCYTISILQCSLLYSIFSCLYYILYHRALHYTILYYTVSILSTWHAVCNISHIQMSAEQQTNVYIYSYHNVVQYCTVYYIIL